MLFSAYAFVRTKAEIINLGFLTSLRILHLSVLAGLVRDRQLDPVVWITDILEKFPQSNRIEMITISSGYTVQPTVFGESYFGIELDSYSHLAGILTKERFPHLREVTFHTLTESNDGFTPKELASFVTWIERSVKRKMAASVKAFVLQFSSGK